MRVQPLRDGLSLANRAAPRLGQAAAAATAATSLPPQTRSMAAAPDPLTLFTIGHSTRPLEELVALLKGAGVRHLVDVRTGPHSRTNPQVWWGPPAGPRLGGGCQLLAWLG